MIRTHIRVYGRVQGVGFRSSTSRVAKNLGLKGWVRNLSDGSVEIIIEGPEETVDKLISWCQRGPTSANVINIQIEKTEARRKFSQFYIKR